MSDISALRVRLHVGRQTEVAYFDKLRSVVNFNPPSSSPSHPPPDYGMLIISISVSFFFFLTHSVGFGLQLLHSSHRNKPKGYVECRMKLVMMVI